MTIRNKSAYTDRGKRVGSEDSLLVKVGETLGVILIGIFIACVIGSMMWGNEGFVYLLASFF